MVWQAVCMQPIATVSRSVLAWSNRSNLSFLLVLSVKISLDADPWAVSDSLSPLLLDELLKEKILMYRYMP